MYFGFGFSHASSMIKGIPVPLQVLAADKHTYRQTDRQTDRQLIAYWIWEGDGNKLIDGYFLHLMPSNFRLHFIRPTE